MITEHCIGREFIEQVDAMAQKRRDEVSAMSDVEKAQAIIDICETAGKRDDVKPDVLEYARSIVGGGV